MKKLEEVLAADKAVACPECGGFVFFDWGLKVLDTAFQGQTPRFDRIADQNNVLICAGCHHPVVKYAGDCYDAATFIATEAIAAVIAEGRARKHAVPVPVMDP